MSLLTTMKGLAAEGCEVKVALARPAPDVAAYFRAGGFEPIACPELVLFDHSTVAPQRLYNPLAVKNLMRVFFRWPRAKCATLILVHQVRPDLVHLNSMPLSASAVALSKSKFPYVWHVREPPPDLGLRTRLIRRWMVRADGLIFLSAYDRRRWVEDRKGDVISNFVDLDRFQPTGDRAEARRSLGIAEDVKVILFLGGPARVKGGVELIRALSGISRELGNWLCLAPGTAWVDSKTRLGAAVRKIPLLGPNLSPLLRFRREVARHGLEERFVAPPFCSDVERLYAASNLVVFPAIRPHFARPLIEAAAMGLPGVAFRLGGIDELIDDRRTGLLVAPSDVKALGEAIARVLADDELAARMGRAGRELAERRFGLRQQVKEIVRLYRRTLHDAGAANRPSNQHEQRSR